MIAHILSIILQTVAAFLLSTFVFDLVHYFFHRCLKSKSKFWHNIGRLHMAHHRFFTPQLQIDKNFSKENLSKHVVLEFSTHMSIILLGLFIFNPFAILCAAIFEICLTLGILWCRGVDYHHLPIEKLSACRRGPFVDANYHALHHVYPSKFYGSYLKLLDWILGTGLHFAGKRVAITGAGGALGSNMKKLLEKEGAKVTTFKFGEDYTYDNYEKLAEPLKNTDILVLSHGTKYENTQEANCDSFVKIIELFKSVRPRKLVPAEIWGVGSEIESHPCFGIKKIKPYARSKRNFARHARQYFRDKDIQYRHLVHSSFISKMGPGLMTASFAAKLTLFLIKRDFKYVPVSYTGFAFLNYFRFVFNV